jgi:hypothetical protein
MTDKAVLRWSDPRYSGFSNRAVHIRYSTHEYPPSLNDGTELYSGTLRTVTHSNLTPGETCYYTIWTSHDGVNFVEP